ncbi:MAG: DNA cytosine methyltransferase [Methanoregula sp.]|jgi:DNA (cytosine-5)-methyltransferase 1|nr:DNA cytosine methyltransferase [Methanoregula sp.]
MTGTIAERPVIVDMFCGSGGESQGIDWSAKKAGVNIEMFAINHWERAIETHRANFPDAEHICRDVADVNPSDLVPGRKVALLWASPACTHFSVARGGKPCDDQSRVTPFTILDWLDKLTVDRLIIENVPEFRSWGPLDKETYRPIPKFKGETFNAFIGMIRGLGYTVDHKVLNAADYGAPTTRRRLFIQAVRAGSGKSILWPEVSHLQPGPDHVLIGGMPSWVSARSIIDWSLPTQIIDERKKPLAANTMKRICRGIEKYWGPYATPFLVRYNGGDNRVHSIDDPLPVMDCSNRYGLVQPLVMQLGQTSAKGRTRSVDEPLATVVTKEEACLIEPLIMPYRATGKVRPASESPLPTLVTAGWIGVIEPLFIPQHSCGEVRPTTGPLSTVATKGAIGLVEPLIMEYYGNGECRPASEPLSTVTTRDRFALITPENIRLGFRMLKPHELAAAQSFPRGYIFTGNRGDVVRQIGNAVCPKIAEALTTDYMKELAEV